MQYDADGVAVVAPFDADGRPDRSYSFTAAPSAAETPNPPRHDRAERLRNLREKI